MCEFSYRTLKEDCVFNANETHLLVIFDDGRTTTLKAGSEIKNGDVVSRDMSMIIMAMLEVGSKPRFEVPSIISRVRGALTLFWMCQIRLRV